MNDILNLEKSVSLQKDKNPIAMTDQKTDYKDADVTHIADCALYNIKYSMNGGNFNGI